MLPTQTTGSKSRPLQAQSKLLPLVVMVPYHLGRLLQTQAHRAPPHPHPPPTTITVQLTMYGHSHNLLHLTMRPVPISGKHPWNHTLQGNQELRGSAVNYALSLGAWSIYLLLEAFR